MGGVMNHALKRVTGVERQGWTNGQESNVRVKDVSFCGCYLGTV